MPTPHLLEEIANMGREIEIFYDQKAKGALIISRYKIIEDYQYQMNDHLNVF